MNINLKAIIQACAQFKMTNINSNEVSLGNSYAAKSLMAFAVLMKFIHSSGGKKTPLINKTHIALFS